MGGTFIVSYKQFDVSVLKIFSIERKLAYFHLIGISVNKIDKPIQKNRSLTVSNTEYSFKGEFKIIVFQSAKANKTNQKKPISNSSKTDNPIVLCMSIALHYRNHCPVQR